ncbi:MAG TPA: hypothetical protein VGH04_11170 [Gemmatimonadaceae bacterium]
MRLGGRYYMMQQGRKPLPRPFDPRRPSVPWTEVAASCVATVALFLTALVSMTSVSSTARSRSGLGDSRARTQITFLSPPATPDRPRETPVQRRRSVRKPTPTVTPQIAEPTAPAAPPTARSDTVSAPTLPPARLSNIPVPKDRIKFRSNAPRSGLGSAAAPAGLTDRSRAARGAATMTSHDSAFAAWAAIAHDAQRWTTMSSATKTEIAESRHESERVAQRVGTAGNSGDVHVMTGQGMYGVGAAAGPGSASIGVPLFSRGQSREQRMRDSVIDAEIRAGMARSAALIAARRDSIRADSIRADSIRKVAEARKP